MQMSTTLDTTGNPRLVHSVGSAAAGHRIAR